MSAILGSNRSEIDKVVDLTMNHNCSRGFLAKELKKTENEIDQLCLDGAVHKYLSSTWNAKDYPFEKVAGTLELCERTLYETVVLKMVVMIHDNAKDMTFTIGKEILDVNPCQTVQRKRKSVP